MRQQFLDQERMYLQIPANYVSNTVLLFPSSMSCNIKQWHYQHRDAGNNRRGQQLNFSNKIFLKNVKFFQLNNHLCSQSNGYINQHCSTFLIYFLRSPLVEKAKGHSRFKIFLASSNDQFHVVHNAERCIQNPVKHKIEGFAKNAVDYFRKTLNRRCLTGF